MNKSKTLLYILCILLTNSVISCGEKRAERPETDERGIPVDVASLLMSDSCAIDTLYTGTENVVRMIDDYDYGQRLIFDTYGLLVYNPTLQVDTVGGDTYRVSDIIRSVEVNFSDPDGIEQLKHTFPLYDDFKLITFGEMRTEPLQANFALSVSAPAENEALTNKLAYALDTMSFSGSFKNLGNRLAKEFFAEYSDIEATSDDVSVYDFQNMLAYYKTSRYVTYMNTYSSYTGGAHGMYGYAFTSYMLDDGTKLTNDYLFKPGTDDDLRHLLLEALASDETFSTNNNVRTAQQAERYLMEYNDGPLPIAEAALLDDGAVFCYQPYEISCYADGAFVLVIPYDKLLPYMTDKGKKLVK